MFAFPRYSRRIISTPPTRAMRREALVVRCQRLLASGQCISPPHWILQLLVSEHFINPAQFDWTKINVRATVYERAIIERDFTDELCIQQRKEQFQLEARFEKMWKQLRPKLDEIVAQHPIEAPHKLSCGTCYRHDGRWCALGHRSGALSLCHW